MASSGEWRRETDASTGRAYFWHPTTGEARWTLDESEAARFDQAARASDPAKGLLHYQNRLKKAVRLVKFPKIEKFRRKIEKYQAIVSPPPCACRGPKASATSRFIGVHWDRQRQKWKAELSVVKADLSTVADGRVYIGHYDDEEEAAREYNAYVRRHGLGNTINPVDTNGKLVPKAKKTSRFWGVSWIAAHSKWRALYYEEGSEPRRYIHVGYFVDEERAALAYNEAVIAADLDHIRNLNRVDASGRPIPMD